MSNVTAIQTGPEPFMSRSEIAAFMHVSMRTMDRWALEGCPYETWGLRTKKFRASEVIPWARTRDERSAA